MQTASEPQSDVVMTPRRRGGKLLYFLLLIVVLFGGISIGRTITKLPMESAPTEASDNRELDLSLFDKVYDVIQREFVNRPAETANLEYGAIKGLVAGLDDPNSNFMDPEETKAFQDNLAGVFEGIGIEIAKRDGNLTVVTPLSGSPAEEVGLKAGDVIVAIDDEDASSLTLDEAVLKIRGEAGTEVRLLITRKKDFEAKEFKITRAPINIESLTYEIRDDGIAVVEISRFGEDTADKMEKAAQDILAKGAKGIVLDLRGNPGGFLESSVEIASFFVQEGVIVSEEFGDGNKQTYNARENARLKDIPLVVLINEGSASASEILAGALQDYERGTLVGIKSFGKGSVQELKSLDKNTSLRLTVAKFVLPKGRKIDHVGIEPDVKIERTTEDIEADRDPQLDKALELVKEKIK